MEINELLGTLMEIGAMDDSVSMEDTDGRLFFDGDYEIELYGNNHIHSDRVYIVFAKEFNPNDLGYFGMRTVGGKYKVNWLTVPHDAVENIRVKQ